MPYDYRPRLGKQPPKRVFFPAIALNLRLRLRSILMIVAVVLGILLCIAMIGFRGISAWSSQGTSTFGFIVFSPHETVDVRKHVRIVWVDFPSKIIRIVSLPDEAVIATAAYGQYPISSIYDLFLIENKSTDELLSFLSLQLRVPIQDVVVPTTRSADSASLKALGKEVLTSRDHTFSFIERLRLGLFFLTTSFPVQQTSVTATQTETLTVLPTSYYAYATRFLTHPAIKQEQPTIAILNASGKVGAARLVSDIITQYGFVPVVVTDSDQRMEQGQLFKNAETNGQVSHFLSTLVHLDDAVDAEQTQRYRADYVLYVGTKLADLITP
ncbi:LytR C-terminal domain-containing protein [Candidatus Woesebacteria bacterium]|nr:LytR C-terminal domain-containing protein [Candidatus Woesebacteria bacterium]